VNLLAWSDSGEQAQFPVPKDKPYLVTSTGVAFLSYRDGRTGGAGTIVLDVIRAQVVQGRLRRRYSLDRASRT
jgi:hypothetical protein